MANVYSGSEPYVFISYAHKDTDKVIPVIEDLQKRNYRVWYDSGIEVGTEWPEYIAKSLDECSCVLAFISEHAQASPNCRREITYSVNMGKPILVVYLNECNLSPGMQLQLGTLHAIYRSRHSTMESFMNSLCQSDQLLPCLEKPEADEADETMEQLLAEAMGGNAASQHGLGMKYLSGDGVPKSEDEAVIWLSAAARQNHVPAMYQLAKCYQLGIGVPENHKEAFRLYRLAASQNDRKAEFAVYLCLYFGVGADQNRKEAMVWCRRAAEHGHATAQFYMGDFCMNDAYNSGGSQENKEAARAAAQRWYSLAAEQNDMHAQYAMFMHDHNIQWCIRAAEQGHLEAQRRLAGCYESGAGVAANLAEAFKWYRHAAEQGDLLAQKKLAHLYREGAGVAKDLEQALVWYKRAASSDNFAADMKRYLELYSM